jgi:peptidylprolyl isomerase
MKGAIMQKAKQGDTVRIHFTGIFDDGSKFATTTEKEPLEFTIGDGQYMKSFEQSLIGMKEGVKRTFRLEPDEAMGERRPDLITKVPRDVVSKENGDVQVGSKVWANFKSGKSVKATVTQIEDHSVTIDANHPLAGEALTFVVELVEIL